MAEDVKNKMDECLNDVVGLSNLQALARILLALTTKRETGINTLAHFEVEVEFTSNRPGGTFLLHASFRPERTCGDTICFTS